MEMVMNIDINVKIIFFPWNKAINGNNFADCIIIGASCDIYNIQ